jgi:hypothetical protein
VNFATYKLIMASWGMVGAVCSAGMYLRAMLRERRVAVVRAPGRD